MPETSEKERMPSTVVNEDEELEKEAVNETKKEDKMDVGTGEEDNNMNDDDDDNDNEENKPLSTPRYGGSGGRRYRGGGRGGRHYRGGRGGRNSRRHTPYRSNNDDNTDRNRRVYVGNLSWNVTWRELKDYMKSTGCEVNHADVLLTPDGRSKGCGIVEFATEEGARRAVLTLNDTELMGRQIFVREDREEGFGNRKGNDSAGGGSAGNTESQNRRVYVGNLSWDVAWQDLKDHMRQAGEVVKADVLTEHDGRSKGCGIVEFANAEDAQQAIDTLNDTDLKGRMIFVREDREHSSGGAPSQSSYNSNRQHNTIINPSVTSVYVGNLAFECSWQDLKDHMRQAGNVENADILTTEDGRSKGCGIVTYQKPQEAQRAIRELQNSELRGRPIFVREDREQSGGGGGKGAGHPVQLFVGNLSYDTTWRDLKDHFRQCGEVERADVMEGPDGRKRGFGTVRYYRGRDAQAAIRQLNGVDFMGRRLEVRVDNKAD